MLKVMLGVKCAGGAELPGAIAGCVVGGGLVGTSDLGGFEEEPVEFVAPEALLPF